MEIAVVGLWHLGSVTAGCLSHLGFKVTAIDDQRELITGFQNGKLPVDEPGLADMINQSLSKGDLTFTTDGKTVSNASVVWITYDTPVDDDDNADVGFVVRKIELLFPYLNDQTVVLISSQLPVGSTQALQQSYADNYPSKSVHFCYSPENLRLGAALKVFLNPDRIIVGTSSSSARGVLEKMLSRITNNVIWMNVASAEMTKHAINAFLANSIVFINEIARICERVGADANEVEKGLKSEERIGPKSYLKPGNAFAGGTLARDVSYLMEQQKKFGIDPVFFNSIFKANLQHRNWIQMAVTQFFPDVSRITISVLGLTYKPGTNTLRRSQSVEFCKWASGKGARLQVYDPAIKNYEPEIKDIVTLSHSVKDALQGTDVIVIATSWPQFKEENFDQWITKKVVVADSNGFLEDKFKDEKKYRYIKIGKRNETDK
jgi:UDPglucose 6-dehydrogenase